MQQLRPDLDQLSAPVPLFLVGNYPVALIGAAYDGTLNIMNASGHCSVESLVGDTLPPGASYFCTADDKFHLKWPAYSDDAAPLPNSGFEDGGLAGWTILKRGEVTGKPAVGSNSAERPRTGSRSGFWLGNKGNGHAGGVDGVWLSTTRVPAYQGRDVTAEAWISLKDTGSSSNRGRVLLVYFDENDEIIGDPFSQSGYLWGGNIVRGNDQSYLRSVVTRKPPINAVTMTVGVWTTARDSANSGVFFDDVSWDAPVIVGTIDPAVICTTVRVRDPDGRVAERHACVTVTGTLPTVAVGAVYQGASAGNYYDRILISYDAFQTFQIVPYPVQITVRPGLSRLANGRLILHNTSVTGAYSDDDGQTWQYSATRFPWSMWPSPRYFVSWPDGRVVGATSERQHPAIISDDFGDTWTSFDTSGEGGQGAMSVIAAIGDEVLTCRSGRFYHSPDRGANWTTRTHSNVNTSNGQSLTTLGNNYYLLVELTSTSRPGIGVRPALGSTFTYTALPAHADARYQKSLRTTQNGVLLAMCINAEATGGVVYVSADAGATWDIEVLPRRPLQDDLVFDGKYWRINLSVVAGESSAFYVSESGLAGTWSLLIDPIPNFADKLYQVIQAEQF